MTITIEFQRQYASIPRGKKYSLPKFSVITGLNGSGKSHFLNGISDMGTRGLPKPASVLADGRNVASVQLINSNQMSPEKSKNANRQATDSIYEKIIRNLIHFKKQILANPSNEEYVDSLIKNETGNNQTLFEMYKRLVKECEGHPEILDDINSLSTVILSDELNILTGGHQAFHTNFSAEFFRYFLDVDKNRYNEYLTDKYGQKRYFVSEEEFLTIKGPPPWEIVNEILKSLELPYQFIPPTNPDIEYSAKLKHVSEDLEIDFDQLSSGEQALCYLGIGIYQNRQGKQFPSLLLLDEPDAHLHPAMSAKLLEILQDVLLPKLEAGIIVVTHSPSTFGLTPTESQFVMDKKTREITPSENNEGLNLLCSGLPITLSNETAKHVFVEANTDEIVYSRIWRELFKQKEYSNAVFKPNFISSGAKKGRGNCDNAEKFCRSMRDAGADVYAILDYDGTRETKDGIIIPAQGRAYSIENMFLAPYAVLGLLYHHSGDEAKLPCFARGFDFAKIENNSPDTFQKLLDEFCNDLQIKVETWRQNRTENRKFPEINFDENELLQFSTRDGKTYTLPSWYMLSKGHTLENLLFALYPEFKKYCSVQEEPNGELVIAVSNYFYGANINLLPKDIDDVFVQLCRIESQ